MSNDLDSERLNHDSPAVELLPLLVLDVETDEAGSFDSNVRNIGSASNHSKEYAIPFSEPLENDERVLTV